MTAAWVSARKRRRRIHKPLISLPVRSPVSPPWPAEARLQRPVQRLQRPVFAGVSGRIGMVIRSAATAACSGPGLAVRQEPRCRGARSRHPHRATTLALQAGRSLSMGSGCGQRIRAAGGASTAVSACHAASTGPGPAPPSPPWPVRVSPTFAAFAPPANSLHLQLCRL